MILSALIGLLPRSRMLIVGGVVALVASAAVALGYNHYTNLLDTVGNLRADNLLLEGAVSAQGRTIDAQQDAIQEWKASRAELVTQMETLQATAERATEETRRLDDILTKHDTGALARGRPGLVERRINSGSARIGRLLECASGADGPDCPRTGGTPDGEAPAP